MIPAADLPRGRYDAVVDRRLEQLAAALADRVSLSDLDQAEQRHASLATSPTRARCRASTPTTG